MGHVHRCGMKKYSNFCPYINLLNIETLLKLDDSMVISQTKNCSSQEGINVHQTLNPCVAPELPPV